MWPSSNQTQKTSLNHTKAEALDKLRSHFNNASLVHVSIDFQSEYCKQGDNRLKIRIAAEKTARLSPEFKKMNIPNWWVYFKRPKPEGNEFYVVKPANDDVIISKNAVSAFKGSSINQQLEDNHFKALLISGIYKSACVYQTVRDACLEGYTVFVMKDCVADYFKDSKEDFSTMLQEGAIIVSSNDVLRTLTPVPV